MQIEWDGAVREYITGMVSSLFSGPDAVFSDERMDDRLRERVVMALLKQMVFLKIACHRYDRARNLDVFESTEKLVRNWSYLFPGTKFTVDRSRREVLLLEGKRTRYFNRRWLKARRDLLPPLPY